MAEKERVQTFLARCLLIYCRREEIDTIINKNIT